MKFEVEILETLKRTVIFESDSIEDAISIAEQQYRDELIVLDSSDFQDVAFNSKAIDV